MENSGVSFGLYLKELRETYGYTLVELGEEIGYSDAYLSQIEKDRKKNPPTIHLLKDLANALDEPYSNLLEKAGYEELAAGQRLLELLGDTSNMTSDETLSENEDLKKKIKVSKKIIDSYLELIGKYELDNKSSVEMVDYLNEVLVSKREYIKSVLESRIQLELMREEGLEELLLVDDKFEQVYIELKSKIEKRKLLESIHNILK